MPRFGHRAVVRSPLSAYPVLTWDGENADVENEHADGARLAVNLGEVYEAGALAYLGGVHFANPFRHDPVAAHRTRSLSPASERTSTFDIAANIRTFKLFQNAPNELIELIMSRMRSRVAEVGDEICREGETAKAMYWIIRGSVAVCSRDEESKFGELHAGQFFGEIGVLFSIPRTASIVTQTRCLLMALTLEDLQEVLPRFPDIERAIREEAQERLELLSKHKNPPVALSSVNLRERIKAVPMFSALPDDILHFLGLKLKPVAFGPFVPILVQDEPGREIFFIVSGTVEVIDAQHAASLARLGPGQFFGELAWLSLSPTRTASVRSITAVECLCLEDSVLQEVNRLYPAMRRRIEKVAQERMSSNDIFVSKEVVNPNPGLVGAGTLTTLADPDPYHKRGQKRKLSQPTRSSPRASTQKQSAASTSAAAQRLSRSDTTKRARIRSNGTVELLVDGIPQRTQFAGPLPPSLMAEVLRHLQLDELVRARLVHSTWNVLICTMPLPVVTLDVMARKIDDSTITSVAMFLNNRSEHISISHCSHLTDPALMVLANYAAGHCRSFALASCWNISPGAIVDLLLRAPGMQALDLSNCRKINDQALFRILTSGAGLDELDLGYCKHITDRSMHCIAVHAAQRLKVLKLSRCTSITDAGFGYWSYSPRGFPHLHTLVLRDCTFLTDNAVVALTNTCTALQHLDLSFCCALSDTSVEVLSLGLPGLISLHLAFCGSAVSDASLNRVAHHLRDLQRLSVRGCVRVTDTAVDAIVSGLEALRWLDITQCRNVTRRPNVADLRRGRGPVQQLLYHQAGHSASSQFPMTVNLSGDLTSTAAGALSMASAATQNNAGDVLGVLLDATIPNLTPHVDLPMSVLAPALTTTTTGWGDVDDIEILMGG
ncbi:hypothetical protein PYCC9005_002485 [Savitreella phatthalungensis]